MGVTIQWTTPALLAERLRPRKDSRKWGVLIISLLGLIQLVRYTLAGFDLRFGGSAPFAAHFQIGMLILFILSQSLFVWAAACNPFFSQVVRIQTERGPTVIAAGPYRLVRHPAYLGAIVFEISAPLLLGCWPALWLSLVSIGLLVLRTQLEDRTLQAELPGYLAYTRQVQKRLLPGIW